MPNVFDERGLTIKGIYEYRDEMAEAAKIAFADVLNGKELRTDDSSMLGRIFGTVAKPLAQNMEILPLILQSFDINSAEGQQLDNLLWNIYRVKRKSEAPASGLVIVHGDLGVTVTQGSTVSNSLTGDIYNIDNDVTFGNVGVNGVDIEVNQVGGEYKITYGVDGLLSQSPSILVQLGTNDTTIRSVVDRLVDAVNSQASYLTASRNTDNTVKVFIDNQSNVGSFTVTGNISIVRSYKPVYITSRTYEAKESTFGRINTIRTPILGWRGVTNPYYIAPAQGIESDESYRERGKLLQGNTTSKYSAIVMAIKGVEGVVYESVQQNTSSNPTNSGITNNGLAITVQGGNEDDIALAIFNSVSAGIATSGDILKEVKDINGFAHEVRFSRPTSIPLEISMSLITYPNFPNNGNALIKQAIVDWFNNLDVGEDIHYSRLYEPINKIDGFAVKNMKFGLKGGTLGLEDVIIKHNELATINAEDINIGGN